MDDWQETQQNTRHMHNRVGRGNKRHGGGTSSGSFDIKRMLGTYDVKCSAAGKLSAKNGASGQDDLLPRKLEVYTLNERGNAVIGELMLGGVVHGVVLFAGSRKVMGAVVRELEEGNRQEEEESEDEEEKGEAEGGTGENSVKGAAEPGPDNDDDDEDEEDDSNDDTDEESITNQRFREFEKNSFRSPKFWLRWQGSARLPTESSDPSITSEQPVSGTGYFVFSGNQCDRFQGTLSCDSLEWDNVKISGWKLRSQPARDFALTWRTE